MAIDRDELLRRYGVTTTRDRNSVLERYGIPAKPDLETSEGLFSVAQRVGGQVGEEASRIVEEDEGTFKRLWGAVKGGVGKALDVLQRPNFAIASSIKNALDDDPETTFFGGVKSGITGRTKHTFFDVLEESGWDGDSRVSSIGRAVTGFALDVLLDPTTYVTFGAAAGVKVGGRTLNKAGRELLQRGLEQGAGKAFGEEFVRKSLNNMIETSPELYAKFVDKGGVKFFGQTLVSGGRIAATTKALPFMSKLDEVTEPIRRTTYALFNRDASAKFGKLPDEFTQIKQRYIDLGMVRSEDKLNKIASIAKANNITGQEAELIMNQIEKGLPFADARLNNAKKLFERELGVALKAEKRAGIEVGNLPNYAPHILVDEKVKNLPFKPGGGLRSLGAAKPRKIEGTVSEINEVFGKEFFDENIVTASAQRLIASERAVTAREFYREVAQKFGAKASRAPSNYVEAGVKGLDDLRFHPAIAEELGAFKGAFIGDEATNSALRAFDRVQNFWKASVTSIFPAFHARNGLSNVFLNFLDIGAASMSPAKNALSVSLLNKNRRFENLYQKALGVGDEAKKAADDLKELASEVIIKKDARGKTWTFGELRREVRNNRVAFRDEFTGFLDIRQGVKEKAGQLADSRAKRLARAVNPFSQSNVAFKVGRRAGNAVEQQARMVNFLTNLERTGDVQLAAKRTKQFLFDYQNLSSFEKGVMRRLVPFYTFTRKNLALQATQLAKQPGKFTGQAKLINTVSDLFSASGLSDEERKNLPEFIQEGLGIVLKRDGKDLQIIDTLGLPIEQAFSMLQSNEMFGQMSPAIRVPLETAIGKSFFFDRDLEELNNGEAWTWAPDFIKDYLGYVEVERFGETQPLVLNATRAYILSQLPPSGRVLNVIRQLEEKNVSGKLKVLRQLSGVRPYGFDMEIAELSTEKKRFRELQDLLEETGIVPVFKRSFIPKDREIPNLDED